LRIWVGGGLGKGERKATKELRILSTMQGASKTGLMCVGKKGYKDGGKEPKPGRPWGKELSKVF